MKLSAMAAKRLYVETIDRGYIFLYSGQPELICVARRYFAVQAENLLRTCLSSQWPIDQKLLSEFRSALKESHSHDSLEHHMAHFSYPSHICDWFFEIVHALQATYHTFTPGFQLLACKGKLEEILGPLMVADHCIEHLYLDLSRDFQALVRVQALLSCRPYSLTLSDPFLQFLCRRVENLYKQEQLLAPYKIHLLYKAYEILCLQGNEVFEDIDIHNYTFSAISSIGAAFPEHRFALKPHLSKFY